MKLYLLTIMLLLTTSCSYIIKQKNNADTTTGAVTITLPDTTNQLVIQTKKVTPKQVVDYAQTLQGIPYLYASTDPQQGFDCSGFITYVFNHFDINVPRSSVDFTNTYHEVELNNAKAGDLILFTGTDSTDRTVGHMGIVISNINDSIAFIHSTSGKANGVTITPLKDYYKGRFVKVIRVFPLNDSPGYNYTY